MSNTSLQNILRLSFITHLEYRDYIQKNVKMLTNIQQWHETLGNQPEILKLPGICDLCECQTTYTAKPNKTPVGSKFNYRVPWWGSAACGCTSRLLNRHRAALRVFIDAHQPLHQVYHVGYYSTLRQWLSQRISNLTCSQYEEGRSPGEIDNDIRYEDLTNLSFKDNSFSTIICIEILEHIPNYTAALHEMARVLTPGGRAILTFPWLGKDTYNHLIRAELTADGSIKHILPPEYHGDPAKPDKILSFRSFGWQILDELRAAGFSSASAEFIFGPLHGYMTLNIPVIVGIK